MAARLFTSPSAWRLPFLLSGRRRSSPSSQRSRLPASAWRIRTCSAIGTRGGWCHPAQQLAVPLVGEQGKRLLHRQPAQLVHLFAGAEPAAERTQQPVEDDFGAALAIPVLGASDRLHQLAAQSRLLFNLPQAGLLERLLAV